jgi:hypothetical protein
MQEQERLGWLEPLERAEPAADAAPGGDFACTVTAAGAAEDGNIYIELREENLRFWGLYSAVASQRREILATALTAISTQTPVIARLTTTDDFGTIDYLFIYQP